MIVTPLVRWPLVVSVHPEGVRERVRQWSRTSTSLGLTKLPSRILVIGSSSGLGLATRIIAATEGKASIGVCHPRAGEPGRTGTPGWYATAQTHRLGSGPSRTVFCDAFSDRAKELAVEAIRETTGQVDLVVYSIAASRRKHPTTGRSHRAVIAAVGEPCIAKTLDLESSTIGHTTIPAATRDQIEDTVAVMGGSDWRRWWHALDTAGVLAKNARSIAFSYQGGSLLHPIYRGGSLGAAKDDLEAAARAMDTAERPVRVVVTSAHVTQSSAVVPSTSLYWSLLSRNLGANAMEGPLEQIHRLLSEDLADSATDDLGRIRIDDRELNPDLQNTLASQWSSIRDETLHQLASPVDYRRELLRCNGFEVDGVDYEADVDPVCSIEGVMSDAR